MTRTATAILASLAALGLAFATPATANDKIDPSAYSELSPVVLLPAVIAELRHTLPDIYSLRELKLCPAGFIKLKAGKPTSWSLRMEFNTRNAAGGYTGIQRYTAIFKNGRVAYPITVSGFEGREGLNGIFNRMIDRQMESCPTVPTGQLEQALSDSGR